MKINQITYRLKLITTKKIFKNKRAIALLLEGFIILRQKIRNRDHHEKYFHKLNLILRKIPNQVLKEVAMMIFHDINDNENFRIEFAFLELPRLMKAFSTNFEYTPLPSSFLSRLDSIVKFKFLDLYFPNWMDLLPNGSLLNPKCISKEFTKYLLEKMEIETFFENHWKLLHSLMSKYPKMVHAFLIEIDKEIYYSEEIRCLNFGSVLYCKQHGLKYNLDDFSLYSTPEEIENMQSRGYLFYGLNEDMKIKNPHFLGIYEENKDSKVNLHNFRTGYISPDRLSDDDLREFILQIIDTSSMMETVRFIERFDLHQIERILKFALIPIKCYLTY
jgi:hypothetical protein